MGAGYLAQSFERLGPDLKRPDLVEVTINPDGRVWTERQGQRFMTEATQSLAPREVADLADQIASSAGATLGEARPVASVTVEWEGRRIRAQVVRPPVVAGGPAIALRFFPTLPLAEVALDWLHGEERKPEAERRRRRDGLAVAVARGRIEEAARLCVEGRLNVLVAGGTSTGKTVALRKLLSLVPAEERIVTIEEAAELAPEQPNVVTLLSDRAERARSADALLTATLRLRPDRIVLGEVRGMEAMTFLEAINTGHGGSLTTLHAETPELAIRRLAIAALKSELPMTYDDMIRYIEGTIDVIVQTGREGGRRGITEIHLPGTPVPVC